MPTPAARRRRQPRQAPARAVATATRMLVLAQVGANPGITKAELCRLTGRSWSTVGYHVAALVRRGDVQATRDGRATLLALRGVPADRPLRLRMLRDGAAGSVLEAVRAAPASRIRDVAEATGLPRKSVRRLLTRLVAAGLVAERAAFDGRARFSAAAEAADAARHPLPAGR